MYLEDVYLTLLTSALGYVGESKLMGQGVDDAALRGSQGGGEGHAVAFRGLLEQEQLRVELEDLGIIQIDVYDALVGHDVHVSLIDIPIFGAPRIPETGEGEDAGMWEARELNDCCD